MNKIKIIVGFLFVMSLAVSSQAQNSLEFNQVLWVTTDTVPPGRVWKVTKVLNTNSGSAIIGYVNGQAIGRLEGYNSGFGVGPSSIATPFSGPMWLPTGSILSSQANMLRWSVIEFIVVP